jgi:hypothetical protein
MGGEMEDKLAQFPQHSTAPHLARGDEYRYIKCSSCAFSKQCPMRSDGDQGCAMRSQIFDEEFAKVEFKAADPITANNLSIGTKYWVDLSLLRKFGIPLSSEEIMLFRSLMGMFSSLYADKKGDLKDQRSESAVPWELDETVKKLKAEVDAARADKAELEKLRKEKLDGKPNNPL